MSINPILISLSENDKRMIFAILIIVILLLVLIGYLGFLLTRLMKWQGKKMDTLIHDPVITKVIKDKRHLISFGRKKNWALFYKQAWIPFIIIMVGLLVLFIRNGITDDWSYNVFSTENGFGTLFFTWKISGEMTGDATSLIRFNKLVVDNRPHFVASAWAGYISAPCFLVGGLWYFFVSSSLLARTIQLYKRSKEVFEKSLDGFNQSSPSPLTNNPEQQNQNPNP